MIEILMAALITRLDAKTPLVIPKLTAMDQVRLAILLVGLLAALVFAVTWRATPANVCHWRIEPNGSFQEDLKAR